MRRMLCTLLLCLTALIGHCVAQTGNVICNHHSTFRPADDSDITVTCGSDYIYLSILLCPIYNDGYNESLLALNGKFNITACHGIADFEASPPVLKFNFSISNESTSFCGNSLVIIDQVDTGQSNVSGVQFVNISGIVSSHDPGNNNNTYHQELQYPFSCQYPVQYISNNSEVSMYGTSLAIRDNKGSFLSTLSMNLFTNQQYTQPLDVPDDGLQLKTRIYVQVKATNLTNRFNVLLDHCYAATYPFPVNGSSYDLFVGCTRDEQTVIDFNGVSQEARFSFEAFRFTAHQNMTVSTFYLHCITRLCENSTCASLLPNCVKKVRRQVRAVQYSSKAQTISSGPIKTRVDIGGPVTPTEFTSSLSESSKSVTGVGLATLTCLLSICCTGLIVLILLYINHKCINQY